MSRDAIVRLFNTINLLLLLSNFSNAQVFNDFGFKRWNSVNVYDSKGIMFNPWVGGLNNIQIGKIDLNYDDNDDLVLFDRHGNKILPFLFQSNALSSYIYAPEYSQYFPSIQHLFQLNDYNMDGKPDIFTYTTGGLMVYRNTSSITPSFEKAVNQFVKSMQGNIYTNLLVTNVDYPAIKDIDDDGDLDILTFWGLGAFVELHKNMSVETYGKADSLLFNKIDYCWGRFSEDIESNKIVFDTCVNITSRELERHTGSTLLLTDINNDNALDLVLGDVNYNNVPALINSGNNVNARMTQKIDSFPSINPINISSFPLVQETDIYNDGVINLISSPFDPSLTKSRGSDCLWLYNKLDDGSINLVTKSFLQEEMIDLGLGCFPTFVDINNDNLIDLVVSNYGKYDTSYYDENMQLQTRFLSSISIYKNTGIPNNPQFTLIESDLAGASSLGLTGLYPSFYDIDNDGDLDMLVGSNTSQLLLFKCNGMTEDVPLYEPPVILAIASNSTYHTPTLIDIDEDGLVDLVTGNKEGKLSYYKNIGSKSNSNFSLITHNFGNINVTDLLHSYSGYSVPVFFKSNNRIRLLVGSESGNIFYYPSISLTENAAFIPKNDIFKNFKEGIRSSVSVANIDNDEFVDLVIGNYSGGVVLYKGEEAGPEGIWESERPEYKSLKISPNPARDIIRITLPYRDNWKIDIYNSIGNCVKHQEAPSTENAATDISKLRSGLYFIVASQKVNTMKFFTGKLIITR